MIAGPGLLITILSFLLVIGPLVFIHEFGHYFAGRLFGVKAETFSIGFGRELFGWTDRRGTRWKVGWLQLGGYVKFKGDMNPAGVPSDEWLSMPPEERAQTFQAKPLWQRAIIVAAGPFINFLFAILAFIAIFSVMGYPTMSALLTKVEVGSAAAQAGFHPGDRVVAIDGSGITTFADLAKYVSLRPGQKLDFTVRRAGRDIKLEAAPKSSIFRDKFGNEARVGTLGVTSTALVLSKLPPAQLVATSVSYTAGIVRTTVVALGQIISGSRSTKELGGPLKMAQLSGQQASLGGLDFFFFMAAISINLGFINLLPIPMLDGGHLAFYAIEAVRRKPLQPKAQEWAFRTGLAALLALMLFVTLNDLASFGLWTKLGGLIG